MKTTLHDKHENEISVTFDILPGGGGHCNSPDGWAAQCDNLQMNPEGLLTQDEAEKQINAMIGDGDFDEC